MPIFRDNLDQDDARAAPLPPPPSDSETNPQPGPVPIRMRLGQDQTHSALGRSFSEESIQTEFCDGPIPDGPLPLPSSPRPKTPGRDLCVTTTSDRAELIERLKRGESPTWVPNRHLESLFRRNASQDQSPSPRLRTSTSPTPRPPPPTLSTNDETDRYGQEAENDERMRQGLAIERPRSALHSGDFTQNTSASCCDEAGKGDRRGHGADDYVRDSHSWLATSPPADFTPFKFERRIPFADPPEGFRSSPSSLSSSLSSSFVYKHPTSPLVQSESNDDDIHLSLPIDSIDIDPNTPPIRGPRRQTLGAFGSSQNVPITPQRVPTTRREASFPYQAHQPRRSLTSTPNFSLPGSSSPRTTASSRSRRPSLGLASSSPLHQTSMVGSYEESILRGRMSTTPSRPLDFLAQIGVLGLGNCKNSLRCPAHVTLPFPAVFYSYATTSHGPSNSDDGPSPYVGQIDLENGLPNPEVAARVRRKSHQRSHSAARPSPQAGHEDVDMSDLDADARRAVKQKRRSNSSPKAPPGGSYRIPEKGQMQIIIKNQNKTAVKLFLVPYDLAGMGPGTKTFIRQRIYSAGGPIIDDAPATTTNERPILRYLVHIHICCPSRGRYYLYKNIQVVFANRVPDGKEKLRNEITLPEPRFTPYKAIRVLHPPVTQQATGPGASLAAEKALWRGSSGFSFGQLGGLPLFDPNEPIPSLPPFTSRAGGASSFQDRGLSIGRPVGAPAHQISAPIVEYTAIPRLNFVKSNVGTHSGSGNNATASASGAVVAEGLLSQRLRSLGMQNVCPQEITDDEEAGKSRRE